MRQNSRRSGKHDQLDVWRTLCWACCRRASSFTPTRAVAIVGGSKLRIRLCKHPACSHRRRPNPRCARSLRHALPIAILLGRRRRSRYMSHFCGAGLDFVARVHVACVGPRGSRCFCWWRSGRRSRWRSSCGCSCRGCSCRVARLRHSRTAFCRARA